MMNIKRQIAMLNCNNYKETKMNPKRRLYA